MEQLEFSGEHFQEEKDWLVLFEEKPGLLIDYLDKNYRDCLFEELPALVKEIKSVTEDRNFYYPHLSEVLVHLNLLNTSFFRHNLIEEVVFFAYLTQTKKKRRKYALLDRDTLKELISLLEYEHTLIKEGFYKIRALCKDYHISLADGVLPALYAQLERCEQLTFRQIFLESNILFDKIILREPVKGS